MSRQTDRHAVITGAFSFTGSAIARELRQRGWSIHTLTNRARPSGAEDITTAPLRFDPEHLERELRGADVFVNTYWIRLPYDDRDFGTGVENCKLLIESARRAAVGRLVHVSVSNADLESNLGYYRGKAEVEEAVRSAGVPYAIARPTLIVGPTDVLTANIAWLLRRFPLFLVPDGGQYRLQPVTLDDAGRIIADAAEAGDSQEVDVAGQEVMTFREYVALVARACGVRRPILGTPGWLALAALRLIEPFLRDTVLTREELAGLAQEKLLSHQAPLGTESVSAWLLEHGRTLGERYVNDRHRHFGAGAGKPIRCPELFSQAGLER